MARQKKDYVPHKLTPEELEEERRKSRELLVKSRYYLDEDGRYWEQRGTVPSPRGDGKLSRLFLPASEWAGNINPYLFEGPNIFIEPTPKPIIPGIPELKRGSDPVDGGNLLMTDEEKEELLRTDPQAEIFIRPFMMGRDFINRKPRWCLWLKVVEPVDIRRCPRVLERIEKCRKFRLSSKSKSTQRAANTPMLFLRPNECKTDYLAIPKVSSEKRKYIPIDWLSRDVIAGDKLFVCENATLFQFGLLNSVVHMSWVRRVSGRLEISYSYSNTIDYNAFPWPDLPPIPWLPGGVHPNRTRIEQTAQAILDARALYPRSSLADLYDERTMPPELRRAHKLNDEAVMRAYGFENHNDDEKLNEDDIVIQLMYMYKDITGCEEFTENYPNREFFREFYGIDDEEDGE